MERVLLHECSRPETCETHTLFVSQRLAWALICPKVAVLKKMSRQLGNMPGAFRLVGPIFSAFMVLSSGITARSQDLLEPLVVTAAEPVPPADDVAANLTEGGDLRDILRMRPNVHAGEAPGTLFSLRGAAQEGTLVVGNRTNPALAVANGVVSRSTNSLWVVGMPAWDIAGLTVEAGPQLFNAGPTAPGGSITLLPRQPEFAESGRFLGEVGSHGRYRTGATCNSIWIPEHLAVRLNFYADGNDGGVTNVADGDDRFAATDRLMARGQLRWRPAGDETAHLDLLVENTRIRGNPLALAGMRPDFELFDRRVALNQDERVPAEHLAFSVKLESSPAPGRKVEAWLAWQDADGYQLADLDNSADFDWWYHTSVVERRLNGGGSLVHEDEGCKLTLGVHADMAEYLLHFQGRGFSASPEGEPFSTKVDETVSMAAVFARGEFELQPDWWGFCGLRIDGQRRKVDIRAKMGDGVPNSDGDQVQTVSLLPELGIEWRGGASTAGLKLTRSYQPGGVSYAFTLGDSSTYDASHGWEIQGYGQWQAESLRVAPRVFFASGGNLQVTTVYPDGYASLDHWIRNAGDVVRYGAELELGWLGPRELYAGIHGGWLVTDFDGFEVDGVRRAGGPLPNAPEWNFGLILAWKPETGWFGESALTWQDETYSQFSAPVATRIEDRLELSARVGYRWGRAEVYGFGHNLLDQDFALLRRDFGNDGTAVQGSPCLPRTLGIGFAIDW